MRIGVNLLNFGPGVSPDSLAGWTQLAETLGLLRTGYAAPRVLPGIAASDQFVERRQLGCLDVSLAAARTGAGKKPWAGHGVDRNVVVAANVRRRRTRGWRGVRSAAMSASVGAGSGGPPPLLVTA